MIEARRSGQCRLCDEDGRRSRKRSAGQHRRYHPQQVEDFVEISVGRIGDDQVFRRDRSSPLEMISPFIVSASDDFRYSPRRYAASAASIFVRKRSRSASYSSIMRTPARTTASADGKFPFATCRAMIASGGSNLKPPGPSGPPCFCQTGCFFMCASRCSAALAGAWSMTKWPMPGSTSMAKGPLTNSPVPCAASGPTVASTSPQM